MPFKPTLKNNRFSRVGNGHNLWGGSIRNSIGCGLNYSKTLVDARIRQKGPNVRITKGAFSRPGLRKTRPTRRSLGRKPVGGYRLAPSLGWHVGALRGVGERPCGELGRQLKKVPGDQPACWSVQKYESARWHFSHRGEVIRQEERARWASCSVMMKKGKRAGIGRELIPKEKKKLREREGKKRGRKGGKASEEEKRIGPHPGDVSRSSTSTAKPTDQHRVRPTPRNPLGIRGCCRRHPLVLRPVL
ncbi:hypothetical protein BP00DRAFT_72304 [Aspergillus indologenus CBS 114.80]|uniref:Uncharacterized protein n=1 Tax=Aspergillus indologenus CBS 114.80 TaxID=1450541 RepID=A0A2V5IC96_9EURO|nr:hypothetical protein BP00DRAFT_72304 [Aspergillus indologenus CBS 114.80]